MSSTAVYIKKKMLLKYFENVKKGFWLIFDSRKLPDNEYINELKSLNLVKILIKILTI